MSDRAYDVIVVGAGPAGSHVAHELASAGHSVAVLEQKAAPGIDVCCTGIISAQCLELLDPGQDVILRRVNSAKLVSPSGRIVRLESEKLRAYVVDRPLLDRALAGKARSRGAQYFASTRVIDVVPGEDGIEVEALRLGVSGVFKARAVVLASGCSSKLPAKLGLGRIGAFLVGAQTEVEARDLDGLEVYFGQKTAPGAFAWLVPSAADRAYAGLLAASRARFHLQKFVDWLFHEGRITGRIAGVRQKPVPVGTAACSYGNRVLVVGDAAGHVKPTTGGGIYFGHMGARIAAAVLDRALTSDDLSSGRLSQYQNEWQAIMGKELSRGRRARRVSARLSDRQLERVFTVLASDGIAETLLNSDDLSFDWHSTALLAFLRHCSVYPLLRIKQFLSHEASA